MKKHLQSCYIGWNDFNSDFCKFIGFSIYVANKSLIIKLWLGMYLFLISFYNFVYIRNAAVHPGGYFGKGSGTVMIEDLQCDGTEVDLHLCRSSPWEQSHCSHDKDVGVNCCEFVLLSLAG